MSTLVTPEVDGPRSFHREKPTAPGPSADRRVLWAVLAITALLAAALVVALVRPDNSTPVTVPVTVPTTVPTTAAPATVPPTSGTTATTVTAPVDTSVAAWPQVGSTLRYDNPVAAARGFAVNFLGFINPVVGPFQAGDTRSGEIEVRAKATGPATTMFVRQLDVDNSWWVLGAATDNIRVTEPSALDTISSPVHLTGTSTAFEATVSVLIYGDGDMTPLARRFVMGGSNGEFGPFDALFEFSSPGAATAGTVVLFTESMEDGRMWEASVIRVRFAP